uniref:CNNM transmembrane domain-containing protein n=1 Tax=Hyaloperonospora arabidopsidis (strain Emoy2) TaxID=559515 RepID=M4BKY1_HYAAE
MKLVHGTTIVVMRQLQAVAVTREASVDQGKSTELLSGDIALQVVFLVLLLTLSAIFAGLGLGLMSLDLIGLEIVVAAGEDERATTMERLNSDAAKRVIPLRRNGNLLLTTLLLGNVAVNVLTSIVTADLTSGTVALVLR